MVQLPAVSVVIPTFRREDMLSESIASALAQEGVELEVIVADNTPEGSAETVVEAISDPCVRFLHLPPCDGKVGQVRNLSARFANHPLVLFLDDDDQLMPGALSALACALEERPDIGLAFGVIEPFGPDAERVAREARYFEDAAARARRLRGRGSFAMEMLFHPALLASSGVMVKIDAFRASGGFDETMRAWEDGECFLRIARLYGSVFVDVPIARRRVGHPSILSRLEGREPILAAYRHMHAQYRQRFGRVEFYALKVLDRFLQSAA